MSNGSAEDEPGSGEGSADPIGALRGLAVFLPRFTAPGFAFGHWEKSPGLGGYWSYGAAADEFVDAAYRLGWIHTGFDWPQWMETEESKALREDADVLARARPEQLAMLLTAYIRGERFCEGALEGAFASGLLVRILERAAALVAAIEADPGLWSWPKPRA